jgi:hypothetical protein
MNAVTFLYQGGMFRSWVLLAGPLSGVKRIIDANFNQVWIESQDNHFFTAEILFNCENQDSCRNWISIENIADIPKQDFPALRGKDCKGLKHAMFPRNPKGQMLECLYTRLPGAESGSEAYFALMADGNVLYWWNGGSLIEAQALFILSTVIVPVAVAVIISIVYVARSFISRARKTKEAANA